MAIDPNIYARFADSGFGSGLTSGFNLGSAIRKNRESDALKEAYAQGQVEQPDGSFAFDYQKTAQALGDAGFGQQAMQVARQGKADQLQNMEMQQKQNEQIFRGLSAAQDPESWEMVKQDLSAQGIDLGRYADAPFSPELRDTLLNRTMTGMQRAQLQQQREQSQATQDYRNAQLGLERQKLAMKQVGDRPKTYAERVQKMGGEQKKRFDSVLMANKAINDMADALVGGESTYKILGDNPFTFSKTRFAEALGRMQSGGAINKEEEKRFMDLAPTTFDSPEMRARKLTELKREMESRLGTFGFKPDEVPDFIDKRFQDKVSTIAGMGGLVPDFSMLGGVNQSVARPGPIRGSEIDFID